MVAPRGHPQSLVCHPPGAKRRDPQLLPVPRRRERPSTSVVRLQKPRIFSCISVEGHKECVVTESPLEERNTATPPTNSNDSNGLGVAHPIATPTQPLNTERNTSLDPDDFWNQEVDMVEMEDLDRAVLREDQARHVLALLRKVVPRIVGMWRGSVAAGTQRW